MNYEFQGSEMLLNICAIILNAGIYAHAQNTNNNVSLYPNPALDFTSLKWEIYDELSNGTYYLMDMQGRKISSGSINQNQGEHVIDTRSLESGTYLVNIYNNGKLKSSNKLVVNKK